MTRAPFAAAQSRPLRILKVVPSALVPCRIEGADREDARAGAAPISLPCAAIRPAMAVPCLCGVIGVSSASKVCATAPASSGCDGVDAGIDHRDQHIVAFGERMRLRQPQLGEFVLRGIAFGLRPSASSVAA